MTSIALTHRNEIIERISQGEYVKDIAIALGVTKQAIDAIRLAAYKDELKAAVKAYEQKYNASYRKQNSAKLKEGEAEWRKNNLERAKRVGVQYRAENPGKVRECKKNYRQNNPAKVNAWVAKRRALESSTMPLWADKFIMEEMYDLAQRRTKATGIAWHVDHIVPLKSDKVCGLHCEQNMRVITAAENMSKNNHHWPGMS